jgi:HK97 family phage prohead protease
MPDKTAQIELRRVALAPELVKRDGSLPLIRGYAAVYYDAADPGSEFRLWSDTVERIKPGAFDRAAREDDVRGLFNHDENQVLGRTKSKTMRLNADARGLKYEITPPDTQVARDVVTVLERGDVDGSSFAFLPNIVTWEEQRNADGSMLYIRWIDEVRLFDVGPVAFPAYQSTEAGIRANGLDAAVKAEFDAWSKRGDAAADCDMLALTAAGMAISEGGG